MNSYIIGATIKRLRREKGLTQSGLGARIGVSGKAVSKWETAKGLPDITVLEPLAKALGVSAMELMSGQTVSNRNTSCNILRSKLYVCPVCGNIIHAAGAAAISCCGTVIPPLEARETDRNHRVSVEAVEDERFITVHHPMTKAHCISFVALVSTDRFWLTKLYPEGNAETRFPAGGAGYLYIYCSKHGLMRQKL